MPRGKKKPLKRKASKSTKSSSKNSKPALVKNLSQTLGGLNAKPADIVWKKLSPIQKGKLMLAGSLLALSVVYFFLFYVTADLEVRLPGPNITYVVSVPQLVNFLYLILFVFMLWLFVNILIAERLRLRTLFYSLVSHPQETLVLDAPSRLLYAASSSLTLGIILLGLVPLTTNAAFPIIVPTLSLIVGSLLCLFSVVVLNNVYKLK